MEMENLPTAYVMDLSGDHPLVFRIFGKNAQRISLGETDNWGIPRNLNREAFRTTADHTAVSNWLSLLYDHLPQADQEQAGTALWMVGCAPEWTQGDRMEMLRDLLRCAGFGMPVPVCSLHAAMAGMGLPWKETDRAVQVQISGESTVVTWGDRGQIHSSVSPVGAHVLDMMILAKNLERLPNGNSTAVTFACDDDYALSLLRRCCFLRERYLYRQPEAVLCENGNPVLRADEAIITSAAEDSVVKSLKPNLITFDLIGGWEKLGDSSWMEAISNFVAGLLIPAGEVPVILTGMTARLDRVVDGLENAIPNRKIFVEDDPALTVCRGLHSMAAELLRCVTLRNVCDGFAEASRQQQILEETYGEWVREKKLSIKSITSFCVAHTLEKWRNYEFVARWIPAMIREKLREGLQAYLSGKRYLPGLVGFELREDLRLLHAGLVMEINSSFRDAMKEAGSVWTKDLLEKGTKLPVDLIPEEYRGDIVHAMAEDYCIGKGAGVFSQWSKLDLMNPLTISRRLYFEWKECFDDGYHRFRHEDLDDAENWVREYLSRDEIRRKMVKRCRNQLQKLMDQARAEWTREMHLPEEWLKWCGCMPNAAEDAEPLQMGEEEREDT